MSREQFLTQLRWSLGNMPPSEKAEVLYDYEEHFRLGMAEGKTEEQIAQELGNPRVIGKSYRIDALLEEPKEGNVTAASVFRAVILSISLAFLNLFFVLVPFCMLVVMLVVLWGAAVIITYSGLVFIFAPTHAIEMHGVSDVLAGRFFLFFAGIGVTALGGLAGIGMWLLTKWFFIGVAAYVKFNARIIRGEK